MRASRSIETALKTLSLGRATTITPINSGGWASVYKVDLENGDRLAVKVGHSGFEHQMGEEAKMLQYLEEKSAVPFPRVAGFKPGILFLNYIENDGARGAADAGRNLAELHNITADEFGFDYDTVFATVTQPNPKTGDWVEFFAEQRLLYMGRIALDAGQISSTLMKRLDAFSSDLDQFIPKAPTASLLHGDFWGGNVLFHQGRLAAFIDPAIYYGDAEADLAFSTLFGSMGDKFFAAYREVRPIEPGFDERIDIYNLWPLLFHAYWFGGGYASSVDGILRRLGY